MNSLSLSSHPKGWIFFIEGWMSLALDTNDKQSIIKVIITKWGSRRGQGRGPYKFSTARPPFLLFQDSTTDCVPQKIQ